MADQTFRNVVGGEFVDAAERRDVRRLDPATGEVYAQAAMSGSRGRRPGVRRRRDGLRAWGGTTPQERPWRCSRSPTRSRPGPTSSTQAECKDTGKPLRLTASEELPPTIDHFRFFAGAARILEGKSAGEYMEDHTSLDPPRADRRDRPGHAVELPARDDVVEDRAGAGGRQHRRAQALRHHARHLDAAGRDRPEFLPPGVLNVVTGDRDTGRALVAHKTPQMVAITGSVRAGMEVAASAATDLKRVHLELGGKAPVIVFDDADIEKAAAGIAEAGYFNAGQDCTAATRVLAGAASTTSSSPRSPRRPATPRPACPTTRTPSTARSTTPTSSPGSPGWSTGCPTTPSSRPAARGRATAATSTADRAVRAASRTTSRSSTRSSAR